MAAIGANGAVEVALHGLARILPGIGHDHLAVLFLRREDAANEQVTGNRLGIGLEPVQGISQLMGEGFDAVGLRRQVLDRLEVERRGHRAQ